MRKHLLWLTFFAIACGKSSKSRQTNKSSIENSVYTEKADSNDTFSYNYDSVISKAFVKQSILSIEEVKQKNRYVDSLTNHKRGLFVRAFRPTVDEKCYYLQVGYDNGFRFVTCYNFYIDPSTKKITIEDVIESDRITIEEWRKRTVARYDK